jgi:hypothetical protein
MKVKQDPYLKWLEDQLASYQRLVLDTPTGPERNEAAAIATVLTSARERYVKQKRIIKLRLENKFTNARRATQEAERNKFSSDPEYWAKKSVQSIAAMNTLDVVMQICFIRNSNPRP